MRVFIYVILSFCCFNSLMTVGTRRSVKHAHPPESDLLLSFYEGASNAIRDSSLDLPRALLQAPSVVVEEDEKAPVAVDKSSPLFSRLPTPEMEATASSLLLASSPNRSALSPTFASAGNARSHQNREAQRTFRAKRQAYVHELESRVSRLDHLTAEVTRLGLQMTEQVSLMRQIAKEQAAQGQILRQLLATISGGGLKAAVVAGGPSNNSNIGTSRTKSLSQHQLPQVGGLRADSPDPLWSSSASSPGIGLREPVPNNSIVMASTAGSDEILMTMTAGISMDRK